MSLQPMFILDQMLSGVTVYTPFGGANYSGFQPQQVLTSSRRVQAFGVDYDGNREQKMWALEADQLGPQNLPFENMWIERSASFTFENGTECVGIASLVRGTELGHASEIFLATDAGIMQMQMQLVIRHSSAGDIESVVVSDLKSGEVYRAESYEFSTCVQLSIGSLTAIGLMNCKNVRTERIERPARQPKKSRRKRSAKLDYHTIVLPGSAGSGAGSAGSADLPRHMVRGHFKTYTDEFPLMGRHTGTYWWGHHVRGDAKHGIAVTDYRVEAHA